jgi:hypothetical protein
MKLTLFFAFLLSIFGSAHAATDLRDPLNRLSKTTPFAIGPIGFAAATSEGEKAYNEIMARSTAVADLEAAFYNGTPGAKCYALAGLFQLDHAKFTELSVEFRKQTARISVMEGCIGGHKTAAQVIDEIASGVYSKKK